MTFFLDLAKNSWGWKIPMVFYYTSSRMMLAAITSLLISIFWGPKFIRKLTVMKFGQTIRKKGCPKLGELHSRKKDTPTMGGILILFSLLVALFLWMDFTHIFTLILLITTLFLGFIGVADDFLKIKHKSVKGLSGKMKLLGQIGLAAFIGAYLLCPSFHEAVAAKSPFKAPIVKEEGANVPVSDYAARVYIPFFKGTLLKLSPALALLFIMFVITGSSNAVNLTDGLDGLATGCLLLVAAVLALVAFLSNHIRLADYLNILYIEGSSEIAVYLSAFVGGCLGFLWYNGYPAEVFMGDTGSLALGGVIGVSAVLLKRELLLALVGGIFVMEALSVIIQVASYKSRNKKRVFLCAPLHHHFEYKGWPETKVVIRFWIIGLLLAIIGMASLKFQ